MPKKSTKLSNAQVNAKRNFYIMKLSKAWVTEHRPDIRQALSKLALDKFPLTKPKRESILPPELRKVKRGRPPSKVKLGAK